MGNYIGGSSTGNEGGGGGGGFGGNGGSIRTTGDTGGAGGGGFGGDGGDVTVSTDDPTGGGGGGGGGLGSRALMGVPSNLGHGGSDQSAGLDGNGYGLTITAGSGGGGNSGGSNAGGGGGGGGSPAGGGGGGSFGENGIQPRGSILYASVLSPLNFESSMRQSLPAGGAEMAQAAEVGELSSLIRQMAWTGRPAALATAVAAAAEPAPEDMMIRTPYKEVRGGLGGGGGGGGVNVSGTTPADGGNSLGGGGGAGGGPSNGLTASGGTDTGNLGGGSGGIGTDTYGSGFGGGGGGGGSGLGGAIFVDSYLNFTLQALSGVPTTFNTSNNTTQAGVHGTGGVGASNGTDGSALGNSIFLRTGSSLTLMAQDAGDLLTLGDQVAFTDDTVFGAGGTTVFVRGKGTVVYNGTTDYQGTISVSNANFKVNGLIDEASILVCRNISFSPQRGTLSGHGTLTGNVFVNSGTLAPDGGETLTLGGLSLNPADPSNNTLGSLVQIAIDSNGTSVVSVTGSASLAGTLQIALDPNALPGTYRILTSSAITGTFDSVTFTVRLRSTRSIISRRSWSLYSPASQRHQLRPRNSRRAASISARSRSIRLTDLRDVEQCREWRSSRERLQRQRGVHRYRRLSRDACAECLLHCADHVFTRCRRQLFRRAALEFGRARRAGRRHAKRCWGRWWGHCVPSHGHRRPPAAEPYRLRPSPSQKAKRKHSP